MSIDELFVDGDSGGHPAQEAPATVRAITFSFVNEQVVLTVQSRSFLGGLNLRFFLNIETGGLPRSELPRLTLKTRIHQKSNPVIQNLLGGAARTLRALERVG
ncbi:MAG TPA: hypothetical protein VF844_21615 [Ktedonobacteraceae bacterium]